jgi:hypothetical protein
MKNSARGAAWLVSALTSCAPAAPDTTATPEATATVESPPVATATLEASATAMPAETAAPVADTRVRDACNRLCERVTSSCPKGRGEACLVQCAAHESKSKGCEAEAEAALGCQAKAKESFCDSVVSQSCQDAFVRMQKCQKGEAAPVAAGRKEPEGWKRVTDDAWGISVLMPPAAAIDASAKPRTLKASLDGAIYEIVEIERPKKLESQAMIKLVLAHVGISCQKELRLNGLVESDKLTFTRFETSCAKGARLHGKLWITEKRVLSLLVREEPKAENREAFLDSIK